MNRSNLFIAAPVDLRFEHRTDERPVLGTATPRLSWVVPDADSGYVQDAYEIEVAREGRAAKVIRVAGRDQVLVPWPAEPLVSREAVQVRVRVSGGETWSEWSEPATAEAGLLRTLPERGTPVVFVDHPADVQSAFCSVAVDDRHGGEVAVAHLLEQGHERIAFAGGPFTLPQITDRLEGSRRAMAAAGRPEDDLVALETDEPTVAAGRLAAQRLIGLPRGQRPTAVFCANDVMALGALQQLLLAGVAVPSDVAIVGYDDIDFASAAAVPLTSVRQPRDRLGRTATELLIAETTEADHEHGGVTFVPELMVRDSTRGTGRREARRS